MSAGVKVTSYHLGHGALLVDGVLDGNEVQLLRRVRAIDSVDAVTDTHRLSIDTGSASGPVLLEMADGAALNSLYDDLSRRLRA